MSFIDAVLSDIGESTLSIFVGVTTFFGLDKFIKVDIDNVFVHEIITGLIKMFFSVVTAIVIYYILEYLKKNRHEKTII